MVSDYGNWGIRNQKNWKVNPETYDYDMIANAWSQVGESAENTGLAQVLTGYYTLIGREINMLKNVRSLTFRLFTDKEDAQNHCNVGNGQLTIDVICNWIEQMDRKNPYVFTNPS